MGGDWIVDWAPVNVYMEAVDTDGNSIISPDMPGMTLTFKGETYTVRGVENQGDAQTKAYLAIMEGRNPKCNRSWKLNGEKHEGNAFRFSGKSLPE